MSLVRGVVVALLAITCSGCWQAACVEHVGPAVSRCWDGIDGVFFREEQDPEAEGLAVEPSCLGDWNDFTSCAHLGFTEPCPDSPYRTRPGEAYACP